MVSGTLVAVEEYLSSTYRPDRDYLEGELGERNMGEQPHGRLQLRIGSWMFTHERQWRIRAVSEVRLQVRPNRFRVPDLMVLAADDANDAIVVTPPLLCIEILSKDDRMNEIRERVNDYFDMGVPVCWIIDPVKRFGIEATRLHFAEVADGILRAGEIEMPLAEVFE